MGLGLGFRVLRNGCYCAGSESRALNICLPLRHSGGQNVETVLHLSPDRSLT